MDVPSIDAAHAASTAALPQTGDLPAFPTMSDGAPRPSQPHARTDEQTLHHALSQLVGGGAKVSVQYRVVEPNEIVTVFTNAETGQVITQFPSEAMVQIAQFFNKLAGAVVDRTA